MNLTKPSRKRSVPPRRGRLIDIPYRKFIRSLGCVICRDSVPVNVQSSVTECAHIGERGLGQKCSDRETAPFCAWHHRIGPESHHRLGKGFWTHHNIDKDNLIASLQALYAISGENE